MSQNELLVKQKIVSDGKEVLSNGMHLIDNVLG